MNEIQRIARWLTSLEIWLVSIAVFTSMLWTELLPVAIGIAAGFWLIRWLANGRIGVRTASDWTILLLVLMAPVTIWATTLPAVTITQVLRLLSGIALYYAIANWAETDSRIRFLHTGLIASGLVLAVIAPFSVEWTFSKLPFIPVDAYQRFILIVSDTIHPNVLAGNLVILLPLPIALLLYNWRASNWLQKTLACLALFSVTSILVLTQSRGGFLALAATLVILFTLRWRWSWIVILIIFSIALVLIMNIGFEASGDYLLASSNSTKSLNERLEIWSRAIYMIQDFPFTGIGMGSFTFIADRFYPFFLAAPGTIFHAHNLFLQIAADLGIPGLIAWLAIFFTIIALSWQIYRTGKTTEQMQLAGLGAGLLASQLALAVHGLTDAVTWGMVRPAPIVWAVWGLAAAAGGVYLRENIIKQQLASIQEDS